MKTPLVSVNTNASLDQLALVYRGATDLGLDLLDAMEVEAETLAGQLDREMREHLSLATRKALETAITATKPSDEASYAPWLREPLASATQGDLPADLVEVPVTVAILLGLVMEVAADHGFDPSDSLVQKHCLAVLGSAGPMVEDFSLDMATLAARIELTGITAHGVVLRVAPRLSAALAMKLGAKAVPVHGPAVVAATGFAYTSYYRAMAQVLFGLMALTAETGQTLEALAERLRQRMGEDSLSALR